MDCNTAFETYLSLDQHDNLPFSIRIHCITCKKCKSLIHKMQYSIDIQQKRMSEQASFEDVLLCATMNSIYTIKEQQQAALNGKEKHSFYSWLLIGILLIAGFISVPFSEIGQWGLDQFGTQFTISFALLCAGSITGYAAMFLVKNITFFNKTLEF